MKRIVTTILSAAIILFIGAMMLLAWSTLYGQTPALTPKETPESQKLAFAIERERGLQLEFQAVTQSIEPQLQPLRQKFAEQDKEVNAQVDAVKKQNGWGADVVLDKNPASPTFGQFVHKPVDVKKEAK